MITISGGINAGLYSDLSGATSYVNQFTSATITNTSLIGDDFKFTVPAGSDFSLSASFLAGVSAKIEDTNGFITKFGFNAFNGNTGNNILGSVTFGGNSFSSATGVNTITNIYLSNAFSAFAFNYQGTMNIYGNIGTTVGSDYPNFFNGNVLGSIINTTLANQTINAGGLEGDLQSAVNNGASIYYTL